MQVKTLFALCLLAGASPLSAAEPGLDATFTHYVNERGDISLPEDVRQRWIHLGSWVVDDPEAPGHGFHDVYTQPETLAAYRENGRFLDGAVLVKEIRAIQSAPLTTGEAEWAGDPRIWFVMIKDQKARFADNPHWGGGWGWALFKAGNDAGNVSSGWRTECLGCHIPAQDNDYVFTQGYPGLHDKPAE